MSRQKLKKFAENRERENVLEEGKPLYTKLKGKWASVFFKNKNKIVLELACGRGEYTTRLAKVYPDKNFIGIDVKGDRLWYGSNISIEKGLNNTAFLRCQIQHLQNFFAVDEVSQIWIVFPDPYPKRRNIKNRLTHPKYLKMYKEILSKKGFVKFKTDNQSLFEYTLEVLKELPIKDCDSTHDLYNSDLLKEHHNIITRYEKKFYDKGFDINYLKFRFAE